MRAPLPRSLRNRLVQGAVCVGMMFACLLGWAAEWRVRHAEEQAVRAALGSRVALARDEVGADGSLVEGSGTPKTDLVQVIGPDGKVRSPKCRPGRCASAGPGDDPGDRRPADLPAAPDVDLAVRTAPVEVAATGSSPAGRAYSWSRST